MSEEVASADSLLRENAQLRRALEVAIEENEQRLLVERMLQQSHHDAWVLIGRIDMALELLPKRPSLRAIQILVTKLRREIKDATKGRSDGLHTKNLE